MVITAKREVVWSLRLSDNNMGAIANLIQNVLDRPNLLEELIGVNANTDRDALESFMEQFRVENSV